MASSNLVAAAVRSGLVGVDGDSGLRARVARDMPEARGKDNNRNKRSVRFT